MKNTSKQLLWFAASLAIMLFQSATSFAQFKANEGTYIVNPTLGLNQSISHSGAKLLLREDGNLVLLNNEEIKWQSNTANQGVVKATFQNNGDFVLLTASNEVKWSSKTSNSGANKIAVVWNLNDPFWLVETDRGYVWASKVQMIYPADPSYSAVGVSGDKPMEIPFGDGPK